MALSKGPILAQWKITCYSNKPNSPVTKLPKLTSKDLDPNKEAIRLCPHFNIPVYQMTAPESDTFESDCISNGYNPGRSFGFKGL